MKPVWMLGALLVFTSIGCDVFLPDVGGEGQECSTADTCRGDLNCREGVCCRNHWVDRDDNCGTCPGNWDPAQDCAACTGNWDLEQDCAGCLGNWDPAQACAACSNHWEDNGDDCGTCPDKWDAARDCAECVGNWDAAQDCTTCLGNWEDNSNDCGTCPGKWDPVQDCAECVGNWDIAQECTVCRGRWVDNGDDCGSCPGNWDPTQDCAACRTHWVDDGDDCGTCPGNWDPGQDCNVCLTGWSGEDCEKVADCTDTADFTLCEIATTPDYYYDICVGGLCISPGCGQIICNAPGPHFTLADTNVRLCHSNVDMINCPPNVSCSTTDYCGQDAQYGWDTQNDSTARFSRSRPVQGQPVVLDNVTGLVWQGCIPDFSGNDCENGSDVLDIWLVALSYCDDLDWDGATDWYLPDEYELLSIVDYETTMLDMAINSNDFPRSMPGMYWTSTTSNWDPSNARFVNFEQGNIGITHKESNLYFRCVRRGPLVKGGAVGARFTVDDSVAAEPVVTDNVTGLDWQGCVDGRSGSDCTGDPSLYDWKGALARCEELNWGNHQDWYLPDIKQLHSIGDNQRANPAIDPTAFPGTPVEVGWSSTTVTREIAKAWIMKFDHGYVDSNWSNHKGDARLVRCVRQGL